MKKFLVLLTCLFLTVGCLKKETPSTAVTELLSKYQSLDEGILSDLDLTVSGMNLETEDLRKNYIKAVKMQYSDLKFEITDERVEGDEATVTANITVYDFYKANKESSEYLTKHPDEFLSDDVYDNVKFLGYKIKNMMDSSDRVDYTIYITVKKDGKKWVCDQLDKTTLEKIHGTYNYESE